VAGALTKVAVAAVEAGWKLEKVASAIEKLLLGLIANPDFHQDLNAAYFADQL